ncbi:hypothetical protein O7626_14450 [Micromonospora sp. WMMD1102]|uniref:hypothetical protein n=1 Tax=Micromonospora sp. WMMD1102 TaxID=3016105 RepID=UPI002414F648|nr:hypothetical protein [Micromonospora sp. WMMD1102]MDG4787115.1 hypothetical protein [Micromonospora sp. WMMD1102]
MTTINDTDRVAKVEQIAWLEAMAAEAGRRAELLRAELAADAKSLLLDTGMAKVWDIPGLATLTTAITRPSATLDDPNAMVDWLILRHPDQVIKVPNPDYVKAARRTAQLIDGKVCGPDGNPIPGLAWKAGGQFHNIQIKVAAPFREVMTALAMEALNATAVNPAATPTTAQATR